jgi:hypothetical protein
MTRESYKKGLVLDLLHNGPRNGVRGFRPDKGEFGSLAETLVALGNGSAEMKVLRHAGQHPKPNGINKRRGK